MYLATKFKLKNQNNGTISKLTFNGIGGAGFCWEPVEDEDVIVVVVDVETEDEFDFFDFFFFQNLSIFKVLNLVEKIGLASPNAFTFLASNFVLSNIRLLFSCEEVFVSFSSDDNSILWSLANNFSGNSVFSSTLGKSSVLLLIIKGISGVGTLGNTSLGDNLWWWWTLVVVLTDTTCSEGGGGANGDNTGLTETGTTSNSTGSNLDSVNYKTKHISDFYINKHFIKGGSR